MKYYVRAQRTEYAEILVVLPDGVEPTGQAVQEELNKTEGRWVIANTPDRSAWLPTTAARPVSLLVNAPEEDEEVSGEVPESA